MKQSEMKHDEDKPMLQLVPPGTMTAIAEVLTQVVQREDHPYVINSWQDVRPAHRYIGAIMRHVEALLSGERIDPRSGESHTSHILCCASFLSWFERNGVDIFLQTFEAVNTEHPLDSTKSIDVRENFGVSEQLRNS